MMKIRWVVGKTLIEIGVFCAKRFHIVGVEAQHDPLMGIAVDIAELVTFKLIDDKQISGRDRIKFIVDQKLLAAGDGEVDLMAIMQVDVHCRLKIVQMCNSECSCAQTVLGSVITGTENMHIVVPPLVLMYILNKKAEGVNTKNKFAIFWVKNTKKCFIVTDNQYKVSDFPRNKRTYLIKLNKE